VTSTYASEPITYTLAFSNTGNSTAVGVVITDVIPISVTLPAFTSSGVSVTLAPVGPTFAWIAEDLAVGEGGTITVTGVVTGPCNPAAYDLTNLALIACSQFEPVDNNASSATVAVLRSGPEILSMQVAQTDGCADTIQYTATVTDRHPLSTVEWAWTFADGGYSLGAGVPEDGLLTGSHALADPGHCGPFTTTLTVTDVNGCAVSQQATADINQPPTVSPFTLDQPDPCSSLIAYTGTFTDCSGDAESWRVAFSEGSSASGSVANPSGQTLSGDLVLDLSDPTLCGLVTGTLLVTDSHGCASHLTATLDANLPPQILSMSLDRPDPSAPVLDYAVTFDDCDGAGDLDWQLVFFDGGNEGGTTASGSASGSYTLQAETYCGDITATLTITDPTGCSSSEAATFNAVPLLTLTKVDVTDPLPATWYIRYQITVENSATVAAGSVWISDTLPAGTYFVTSGENEGWTFDGTQATRLLTNLPAGASQMVQLTLGTHSYVRGTISNTVGAQWGCTYVTATEGTTITAPPPPTPTPTATPMPGPWTQPRVGFLGSPHGLPDFNGLQQAGAGSLDDVTSQAAERALSESGPAAAANALWFLDAQAEAALHAKFGLVTSYGVWDDHSPINVPPLLVDVASHLDQDDAGVSVEDMVDGLSSYLNARNMGSAFQIEVVRGPSAAWLAQTAQTRDGVAIILLGFWQSPPSWTRPAGHWATLNAVDVLSNSLELADPWFDRAADGFPGRAYGSYPDHPAVYNDSFNVSYDAYRMAGALAPGASTSLLGYGGADLAELVSASAGQNAGTYLVPYPGAFEPLQPVESAIDYVVFLEPVRGYPVVEPGETPSATLTLTTTPTATPSGTATQAATPAATGTGASVHQLNLPVVLK
jgi:uncharacterized repeat protein (TIGR01451 family)